MAIEFRKDGTIYCSYVKYRQYYVRNLIAGATGMSSNGCWTNASTGRAGKAYKSYSNGGGYWLEGGKSISQNIGVLGRKSGPYMFYMYVKPIETYTMSVNLPTIRVTLGGTQIVNYTYASGPINTDWILLTGSLGSSFASNTTLTLTISNVNSSSWAVYVCRPILICYGEIGYPSYNGLIPKSQILELETCICQTQYTELKGTRRLTKYSSSNSQWGPYDYMSLNSDWEPRNYMYCADFTDNSTYTGFKSELTVGAGNDSVFFVGFLGDGTHSSDYVDSMAYIYADSSRGGAFARTRSNSYSKYNLGGGMHEWKFQGRILSGISGTFSKTEIDVRGSNQYRFTDYCVSKLADSLKYFNTSVTTSNVNYAYCERFFTPGLSMIRIKDPTPVIRFNTDSSIECNDIIIDPTSSNIRFDYSTGTIYCKNLIQSEFDFT